MPCCLKKRDVVASAVSALPGYRGPCKLADPLAGDLLLESIMEAEPLESSGPTEKAACAALPCAVQGVQLGRTQSARLEIGEAKEVLGGKRKRTMTAAAAACIEHAKGGELKHMRRGAFLPDGESANKDKEDCWANSKPAKPEAAG